MQYDVAGKVTGICSDAAMTVPIATYTYDEAGNRIKMVNAIGTTYYVYDPSGNVLAIYTATTALPTPLLAELPVSWLTLTKLFGQYSRLDFEQL
ncbi:putative transcriptional regulator [Mucilaginibacter lappiensis]